jgi:hypothetical protein
MLRVQTQDYIKALSDAALIEYVREGIYEPEAIVFAQSEIARRNIEPGIVQDLAAAADQQIADRRIDDALAAKSPLSRKGRLLAFLGGCCGLIFLPPLLAATIFEGLGHERKKNEVWKFTFIGFAVSVGSVLLVQGLFPKTDLLAIIWPSAVLIGVCVLLIRKPEMPQRPTPPAPPPGSSRQG